jgi:hypothetical protein
MRHGGSVSRQVGNVKRDRKLKNKSMNWKKCASAGTDPNGANLRVVWGDFICGFLVAGAMADLDHLMSGNIQ